MDIIKTLDEIVSYKRGELENKAFFSKEFIEGYYPVISAGVSVKGYYKEFNRKSGVCISSSGANAGHITIMEKPFFAADCFTLQPKDEKIILEKFFNYKISKLKQYIFSKRVGSAQPHVYYKDIKDKIIEIPKIDSQKSIIDIIEKFGDEKFSKYSNIIDINSAEACLESISSIIDIIEPFEEIKIKALNLIKKIVSILKKLSNLNISRNSNNSISKNILFQNEKYINKGFYITTSNINNNLNILKEINFLEKTPTRARLEFKNKVLYISKLNGEEKIIYRENIKKSILFQMECEE